MKTYSPTQFALFRIVFGLYLAVHFFALIPWAGELFSGEGVLPDPALNLLPPLFPNPLVWFPSAAFAQAWVVALGALALLLTAGWQRRWVSVLLWFGWATLFNRNNLISNPSLPYVGVLLLFLALVPDGEPWRWRGRVRPPAEWGMPRWVYAGAWFLMAAGYTFSGWTKLGSPSWWDGTAFRHLIDNPLARPNALRELFLSFPPAVIAAFTWSVLVAELTFLPLSLWRWGRLAAWAGMVGMHVGILAMVDFADLTLGMLMIHIFTFDPEWVRPAREGREPSLLLYDGECGLCNAVVRWLMREDRQGVIRFAALQSARGQELLRRFGLNTEDFDSLVFVPAPKSEPGVYSLRTTAVLEALARLGGVWRLLTPLRLLPASWRDPFYVLVARLRYRLFGTYVPSPWPDPAWAERVETAAEAPGREN